MAMHKIFKSPSDVKAEIDVIKGLKKSIKILLSKNEVMKFILKGESFDYDGVPGAFLFLGVPKGEWKKYMKDEKTSPDFASGFCKAEEDANGNTILKLEAKGKGEKEKFLKALNKGLLKKIKIEAQFVDSLGIVLPTNDEGEEETEQTKDNTTKNQSTEKEDKLAEFKQKIMLLKVSFEGFKAILKTPTADGAKSKLDSLLDLIEDCEVLQQEIGLPKNSKEATFIQTIEDVLLKNKDQILTKESAAKVKLLEELIKNFEKIPKEDVEKGLAMQEDIEDLIVEIQDLALVKAN